MLTTNRTPLECVNLTYVNNFVVHRCFGPETQHRLEPRKLASFGTRFGTNTGAETPRPKIHKKFRQWVRHQHWCRNTHTAPNTRLSALGSAPKGAESWCRTSQAEPPYQVAYFQRRFRTDPPLDCPETFTTIKPQNKLSRGSKIIKIGPREASQI